MKNSKEKTTSELVFPIFRLQAFTRFSSDSVRLGAEHDRRIFPMSSTGDVTFDILPRTTGNEAVKFSLATLGHLVQHLLVPRVAWPS